MKTATKNKISFRPPIVITLVIFTIVVVSITIFAIANNSGDKSTIELSLDEAKNELQMVEDELVSYIPENVIVKTYPRAEKANTLFECGEDDTFYWPGSAQFDIRPETDSAAIMQEIYDDWSQKPGWTVKWIEQDANNVYHLDMQRDDGLNFGIMNLRSNTVLQFLSFSPCFKLSNYDPNSAY